MKKLVRNKRYAIQYTYTKNSTFENYITKTASFHLNTTLKTFHHSQRKVYTLSEICRTQLLTYRKLVGMKLKILDQNVPHCGCRETLPAFIERLGLRTVAIRNRSTFSGVRTVLAGPRDLFFITISSC